MVEMFLHIIFFTRCNCIDIGLIFLICFYGQQIDVICQFRDSKIIASFDYLLLEYFFFQILTKEQIIIKINFSL